MLDEAAKHIREAIMLGRTDILKKLLEEVKVSFKDLEDRRVQYNGFLNHCHPSVGTFLHEAVKTEKKDVVRALLMEGADPGVLDEGQDTAIDLIGSIEMRQVFADVLIQSAASGQIDQMERLLRAGIDVSAADTPQTQNSPLHWAASFGNAVTVQILLEQFGADPNLRNAKGMTALHDSVLRGNLDIVKVLIKFGADPTIKSLKNESALHLSSQNPEMLKTLKSSSYLHNNLRNGIVGGGSLNRDDDSSTEDVILHATENSCSSFELPSSTTTSGGFLQTPEGLVSPTSSLRMSSGPSRGPPAALSPVPPVITDERFNLLCPQPKHMHQLSDELNLFPDRMTISISPGKHCIHDVLDVWDIYRGPFMRVKRRIHLSETQPRNSQATTISCTLSEALFATRPAYKMTLSNHRIKIQASDLTALRHAITTLIQLFALFYPDPNNPEEDVNNSLDMTTSTEDEETPKDHGITSIVISDWPDFAMRAVLLDLNPYGRVPKMDTLLGLIDLWSLLKINQFHAFFRVGNTDASYLSYCKRDYMTLDRYTMERGIDFVPAIDVDSSVTCLADLHQLRSKVREILRCFDRPKFIHLGPKITSILTNSESISIYDYIPAPLEETTFMLCANGMTKKDSKQSSTLVMPENVILVHYGFQKEEAFSNALSGYIEAGLPVAICSGTNAWSNLAGHPDVAFSNTYSASKTINKVKGSGLINAHWSAHPSMTHVTFAWPAFITTACLSWNCDTPENYLKTNLPNLLTAHVFQVCGFNLDASRMDGCKSSPGQALLDLGNAEYALESKRQTNIVTKSTIDSILLRILMATDDVVFDSLGVDDFAVALQKLKKAQTLLVKSSTFSKSPRTQALNQELFLTSELLILSARIGRSLIANGSSKEQDQIINVGVANLPPTFRTDIANKTLTIVEQYRALWLSRYEPQGMQSSLLVLSNLLSKFIPEGTESAAARR